MDFLSLPGGGLFSSPSVPAPPPPPPPPPPVPQRTDPEVEEARRAEQTRQKRRRGARAILTGPQGAESDLGSVARPQARSGAQVLGQTGQ